MPAETEPHSATRSLHHVTGGSQATPSAENIDEDLMSFLLEFMPDPGSDRGAGQADPGGLTNGLLPSSDDLLLLDESLAEFVHAAATDEASTAAAGFHSTTEAGVPLPRDSANTGLTGLMSELQQLNALAKPM